MNFLQKSNEGLKFVGGTGTSVSQSMSMSGLAPNQQYVTAPSHPYYLNQQQQQLFTSQNENALLHERSHAQYVSCGPQYMEDATELNTDRTANKIMFLEEKLRKADEVLRESSYEIMNLREERERLVLETDRLRLQLEQTATQLALVEDQKAENELGMKREIKYLLEQWI